MTVLTAPSEQLSTHPRPASTPFGRVLKVVKLQLIGNPMTTIGMPWMILGFIFIANLLLWIIVAMTTSGQDAVDFRNGLGYSGSSFYIFVYMLVVAIQAFSITFRFALGLGVTRKNYWLGSAVSFVTLAAMYSVGLTTLAGIERATDGWGLGGRMFSAIYFGDEWWQRLLVFFFGLLFSLFVGSLFAAVWVRFKGIGMVVLFGGLGLVTIGAIAWFSFTRTWNSFADVFVGATSVGIASWLLVPAALAALLGFLILRGATARG
ncbi:MAG: ABC transporter permease [Pseudolysinimonas sp.]